MPIVQAVGVSVSSLDRNKKTISKLREEAMSKSILESSELGITDPAEIRKRMLEAYKEIK